MRLIHWIAEGRRWPRPAAALALAAGLALGAASAYGLPGPERDLLAARVFVYAAARAQGEGAVFAPALDGWLRAAAPVWVAGLWPGGGIPLVLLALGLHAFALGMGLGVAAAASGGPGLAAGVYAVLPGNLLALPALWWLGARALNLAAARRAGRGLPVPGAYLQVGAAVLVAVTCSSVAEAALAPVLLRAVG